MTLIKINNTGEIKEIRMIDPKTGCDYSSDFIGNHIGADDMISVSRENEDVDYTATAEQADWWVRVCADHQTLAEEIAGLTEDQTLQIETGNWGDCDLEDQPAAFRAEIATLLNA